MMSYTVRKPGKEKAIGDMYFDRSGSDEGWGRYYGPFGHQYNIRPDSAGFFSDSAETATGDASSEQIRAYNYASYFNNRGWYDSAEKAVGDGYFGSSASSDQRRYYGYYGYGSSDKAASIFAVSMDSPATTFRNVMALVGLVAVVYGASMHYCVRKGEAVITEI